MRIANNKIPTASYTRLAEIANAAIFKLEQDTMTDVCSFLHDVVKLTETEAYFIGVDFYLEWLKETDVKKEEV